MAVGLVGKLIQSMQDIRAIQKTVGSEIVSREAFSQRGSMTNDVVLFSRQGRAAASNYTQADTNSLSALSRRMEGAGDALEAAKYRLSLDPENPALQEQVAIKTEQFNEIQAQYQQVAGNVQRAIQQAPVTQAMPSAGFTNSATESTPKVETQVSGYGSNILANAKASMVNSNGGYAISGGKDSAYGGDTLVYYKEVNGKVELVSEDITYQGSNQVQAKIRNAQAVFQRLSSEGKI